MAVCSCLFSHLKPPPPVLFLFIVSLGLKSAGGECHHTIFAFLQNQCHGLQISYLFWHFSNSTPPKVNHHKNPYIHSPVFQGKISLFQGIHVMHILHFLQLWNMKLKAGCDRLWKLQNSILYLLTVRGMLLMPECSWEVNSFIFTIKQYSPTYPPTQIH